MTDDENGKVIRFTRYESVTEPKEWGVSVPLGSFKDELYRQAMKPSPLFDDLVFPPLSHWARFKLRLDAWLPRIHFGPCDHSGCE